MFALPPWCQGHQAQPILNKPQYKNQEDVRENAAAKALILAIAFDRAEQFSYTCVEGKWLTSSLLPSHIYSY